MRFDEQVHWSEGLFLQPHHLQRMQRLLEDLSRKQRQLVLPFAYGWCDLEIDLDALKSRRIVVKRMSAVMPDGQELSMPGNCSLSPLTLNYDESNVNGLMIYLRLPRWSDIEPNQNNDGGRNGRFVLRETSIKDENTSDNEIPVMMRSLNASLTADAADVDNFTLLPLCRVNWTVINSSQPSLRLDDNYMPPFITVSDDCPLLSMCSESLFQMRSARNSLTTALADEGYDPSAVTPRNLVKLIKLKILMHYENRLNLELVPDRITPFNLYLELVSMLGELQSMDPFSHAEQLQQYDHDDARPAFRHVLDVIRSILMQGGVSSALAFAFKGSDNHSYLELSFDDERITSSTNVFLALSYGGDLVDRVKDIEAGDKFRLLDRDSFGDRIRGVKLVRLRYPPQFLPSLSNTVWFRLMNRESERMWSMIAEEKCMIIDCVQELFPNLKATLYVSIEEQS